MCSTIENLIKHNDEQFALEAYTKTVTSKDSDLPLKIKKQNSFYVSIFYKGKLVKGRIVSSSPKDSNLVFEEEVKSAAVNLCNKLDTKEEKTVAAFVEVGSTFALKVGYICIVVKNHNIKAARLFAYILGAFITSNKSLTRIKEWGSYNDLFVLAKNNHHIEAITYFNESSDIALARIGGHH